MRPTKQLQSELQDLIQSNPEIFQWLTEDTLNGIWYCNPEIPNEFFINDAFWKSLGYNWPGDPNLFKSWNPIASFNTTTANPDDFDRFFNFQSAQKTNMLFRGIGKLVRTEGKPTGLIVKFKKEHIENDELLDTIQKIKKLDEIFEVTNKMARIGGWEVDLITNNVTWTEVTREIHEVEANYKPRIVTAISFFNEGWSRDLITRLFTDAIEKGESFDTELKMTTAKGKEIWVRTLGKPEMKNGKCVRVYGAFQDISTKKNRELEYEIAQDRFEKIFDNSSIGIVIVDKDNELMMANPASLDLFGLKDADTKVAANYLSYMNLIHPDDRDLAASKRAQLLSGEIDAYSLECRYYKSNGQIIWCRVNTSMVHGRDVSEDFIIAQLEDITAGKELEQEALENANRFISAFEHSPNGMALVALDGKWLMINEGMSQIIGYTKEEFLTHSIKEVTIEEDWDIDKELLKDVYNNRRKSYSIEKRYIHKDGSIVYGLLNVSMIRDNNDNPLYYISQINDVTKKVLAQQALKESLNEFESLQNAATQVSIIQANLEGKIIKYNKGAENLLGYTAEEALGTDIIFLHDQDEVLARCEEYAKNYNVELSGFDLLTFEAKQGKYYAGEWTFICKNGNKFPVQMVVTPTVNHQGVNTGYLGIATDISRLKEMEASLKKEKLIAEIANKSKSEFLANMSHEIRTPLNGVIGFTDLLMKTELSPVQDEYLQLVNTSARSLLDLINDILDFSKIEAGKLELHLEKTDIAKLCNQTIDIVKHQADVKGLKILLNISPDSKQNAFVDPVRLRQILINLMGNALKFTEKGEIELMLKSMPCDDCDDEVILTFSVRDTGVGIAPQNLQKIFNAFDQEDASTTRKYGGTGLGLTISNRLLELMGSKLKVESVLNSGSVFSFEIRLKVEDADFINAELPININKVLLVDEDMDNLVMLKDLFAARNIDSEIISNSVEAIEILENDRSYDFAVINYNMPYLNGVDLIRHIRNGLMIDSGKLPVMLIHDTADTAKIMFDSKDLDIQYHFTKPLNGAQLFDRIINYKAAEDLSDSYHANGRFDMKFNIMVAEDNPVNKILASAIIRKALPNAIIHLANDGLQAVELYRTTPIDLILMDIQMPNMNGLEAAINIRAMNKQQAYTPIIALTAGALKGEKEKCLEAGMDSYITKPVIYETIRQLIELYLITPGKNSDETKGFMNAS